MMIGFQPGPYWIVTLVCYHTCSCHRKLNYLSSSDWKPMLYNQERENRKAHFFGVLALNNLNLSSQETKRHASVSLTMTSICRK